MTIRAVVASGAIVVGMLAGCGPDKVTLPVPPMAAETAQLVALYDMPTAVVDKTSLEQSAADIQARLDDLHIDWLPDVIVDELARLRQRLDAGELAADPSVEPQRNKTQVTALVELQRICAGWDSPVGAPDRATNGSFDVTAIVDDGRLNPEVWGTAGACRVRSPRADLGKTLAVTVTSPTIVRATLDGTLIVYLLGPVPTSKADAQLLVSFNGTIAVADGPPKAVSFDFELVKGTIRFRVPAGGGDAIVTVGATVGVQAANGGFTCDLITGGCQPT